MTIDEIKSQIEIKSLFDKTLDEVVDYFKSKGIVLTQSWKDYLKEVNRNVFSISKISRLDLLQDVYSELLKSIRNGDNADSFKKNLSNLLMKKGWMAGELTSGNQSIITSPWRLNLVFRQNVQTSYMAGRLKQQMESNTKYWQYTGVLDRNTRPTHATLIRYFHDKVLPASDPFWDEMYPPNGFNCRCRVRAYNLQQVRQLGLTIIKILPSHIRNISADEGFDHSPLVPIKPDKSNYSNELKKLI